MDLLIKALPYVLGLLTSIGAGMKWLYGQLKEERDHYEALYLKKEAEVEQLKDDLNKKDIEIIKLKASQKDAFFDRKDQDDD